MSIATIGTRFQVVIPLRERKRLGLKPRTKVSVELREGAIVMRPLPNDSYLGLGAELSNGVDATDYVRELRAEWTAK